jgi:hypothetical protein
MFRFIVLCLGTLFRLVRARRSLLLENLPLRQLKRRHPRPSIGLLDKLFWVTVRFRMVAALALNKPFI